jgi:hypothetical protein
MAKTAPRTIILKGRGIRREAPAGGTITPGHLVTINTSGQLVVHATAGGANSKCFAVEAENLNPGGSSQVADIDTNYAANDYVQAEHLYCGCEVNALVAAAAPAIVIGDLLESAGNGTLRKLTTGVAIAQALKAVDNSGGGSPVRISAVII